MVLKCSASTVVPTSIIVDDYTLPTAKVLTPKKIKNRSIK